MKKVIGLCAVVLTLGVAFIACEEDNNGGGGRPQGASGNLQFENDPLPGATLWFPCPDEGDCDNNGLNFAQAAVNADGVGDDCPAPAIMGVEQEEDDVFAAVCTFDEG